jgi:type III pantothenate kinase
MKHIALDFGNSRVKCYAQGPHLLGAFAYSASEWDSALLSTIINHVQKDECLIGISSVNPAMDQKFNQILDEIPSLKHIRTKSLLMNSGIIDFSEITGMGEDRMHGLFGAFTQCKAPLITIDCGTAITFNILDAEHKCLGGSIMPGLSTMYEALGTVTSGLPKLAPNPTLSFSGSNTHDAIHAGISSAISGAIRNYLDQFSDFSFCIFGGDAEAILEIMDENSKKRLQFKPDSIGQGIFKALILSKDSNH